MPNKLVNVGLHLQMLKFGPLHDPTQPLLEDNVKDVKVIDEARKHSIDRIGVVLSYPENRALFSVQRLLDDTGFKGNARAILMPRGNAYKMTVKKMQPVLDVSIAEFLDAFGVEKKKSARHKMEFNVAGRRMALAAVESLAEKKFLLVYDRDVYDEKQQGRVLRTDVIETVDTLIKLERVERRLIIIPSPILFDQHDTYYMILPANLYTDVISDRQISLVLFIEYLFYHYERERSRGKTTSYIVIRHMDTLAAEIGLGNLLESRQRARVRSTLNSYYEFAKTLGYLSKVDIDAPGARYEKVDRLHIRATTMSALRKVAEV